MTDPTRCDACGVEWEKHVGIIGTCIQLKEARKAIKIMIGLRWNVSWTSISDDEADMEIAKFIEMVEDQ
jgi:rRNA processing protein Krr1/Pno1